jgi:ankyrin repeat protein
MSDELFNACIKGDFKKVELILADSVDVNYQDDRGGTVLSRAAHLGYTNIVELLLDYGFNIEHRNDSGETPLMSAVAGGKSATVEFLLEKGADIRIKNNCDWTLLMVAVMTGRKHMVSMLLYLNVGLDDQDDSGYSALHWTTMRPIIKNEFLEDHYDIPRLLIEKGANVNLIDELGKTAFMLDDKLRAIYEHERLMDKIEEQEDQAFGL